MRSIELHTLMGGIVQGVDGEVGSIYDIYFSDEEWRVKYFVVLTGEYFKGRRLLVQPGSMHLVDARPAILTVPSTRQEILASPEFEQIKPVSLQREEELHPHFLWFPLFTMGATVLRPLGASEDQLEGHDMDKKQRNGDPHLHSVREVLKYEIRCRDHPVGRVEDFIAKEMEWRIAYVRLAVRQGIHFEHIVVPVAEVEGIHWGGAQLRLAMDSADVHHYAEAGRSREPKDSTMDDTLIMRP